jgi:hypothetical protein
MIEMRYNLARGRAPLAIATWTSDRFWQEGWRP